MELPQRVRYQYDRYYFLNEGQPGLMMPEELEANKDCLIQGVSLAIKEIFKLINNPGYSLQIIPTVPGDLSFNIYFENGELISKGDGTDYINWGTTIEEIEALVIDYILDWAESSFTLINKINKVENGVVNNVYTKPDKCFNPGKVWNRTISRVKKNNRLIKRNETFLEKMFEPMIANKIARNTAFGSTPEIQEIQRIISYFGDKAYHGFKSRTPPSTWVHAISNEPPMDRLIQLLQNTKIPESNYYVKIKELRRIALSNLPEQEKKYQLFSDMALSFGVTPGGGVVDDYYYYNFGKRKNSEIKYLKMIISSI